MGNRLKKSDFLIVLDSTVLTLMKLRKSGATRLSKVPKGAFRCILEYCEPTRIKRVNKHYKFCSERPIDYTWPEQVSYENPVRAFKYSDSYGCYFRLQSGEKNEKIAKDDGFVDLDWSQITSLVIRYYSYNSQVAGFEFYNSQNK